MPLHELPKAEYLGGVRVEVVMNILEADVNQQQYFRSYITGALGHCITYMCTYIHIYSPALLNDRNMFYECVIT